MTWNTLRDRHPTRFAPDAMRFFSSRLPGAWPLLRTDPSTSSLQTLLAIIRASTPSASLARIDSIVLLIAVVFCSLIGKR